MLWNIATDLAINSILCHTNLPEGGLLPGKPLKLDNVSDSASLAVWKRLSDLIKSFPLGNASEWYMEKLQNDNELKDAIDNLPMDGEGVPGMDDHDGWGDLSDEERQIMDGKVKEILGDAIKKADSTNGWGSVSSETRKMLRKAFENSIDWKKVLQNFVGKSQRLNKSRTHKKINRKYPYIHPGVKRDHTSNIAVYIDQSGSVSDENIEMFFGALSELSKSVEFTVYLFDCTVDEDSCFRWKKRQSVELLRTRMGGTCFTSVTNHFNKTSSSFDGYIILTDGCAPKPPPSRKKRCWIVLPSCRLAFDHDRHDTLVTMSAA